MQSKVELIEIEKAFLTANKPQTVASYPTAQQSTVKKVAGTITPETVGTTQTGIECTVEIKETCSNSLKELESKLKAQRKLKIFKQTKNRTILSELKKLMEKIEVAGNSENIALSEAMKEQTNRRANILQEVEEITFKINSIEKSIRFYREVLTSTAASLPLNITPYQERLDLRDYLIHTAPCTIGYSLDASRLRDLAGASLTEEDGQHPLEQALFRRAFNVLEEVSVTPTSSHYLNNAILVDCFVRDKDTGTIKSDNGVPEIHTVVLWKTGENAYLVIDPNNTNFIKELEPWLQKKLPDSHEVRLGKVRNRKLYQPNSSDEKRRDCTDIAVKIVFELNEEQKRKPNISIEEIVENMVIKLTNQPGAMPTDDYKNPNSARGQAFASIKHMANRASSNSVIREEVNSRLEIEIEKNNSLMKITEEFKKELVKLKAKLTAGTKQQLTPQATKSAKKS